MSGHIAYTMSPRAPSQLDVASLVQSINSSFEEAVALVRRIRDQRLGDYEEKDLSELIDSLSLGPLVIRGYYSADVKRFGHVYTRGDTVAREALKDVVIHLQITVLTALRTVLVDEGSMDIPAVQSASDDCRVNAGVCLGQLSQRLSNPQLPQHDYTAHVTAFPVTVEAPPMKFSHSHSSNSSNEGPRTPTDEDGPLTPDLDVDYPGRLAGFNPYASSINGKAMAILHGAGYDSPKQKPLTDSTSRSSVEAWMRRKEEVEDEEVMNGNVYSDEETLPFPSVPVSCSVTPKPARKSVVAVDIMSRFGGKPRKECSPIRERYGPDDYEDTKKADWSSVEAPSSSAGRSPHPSKSSSRRSVSMHHRESRHIASQRREYSPPQHPVPRKPLPAPPNSYGQGLDASHNRSNSMSSVGSTRLQAQLFVQPLALRSTTSVDTSRQVEELEDQSASVPPVPVRSSRRNMPTTEKQPLSRGARKILGDIDPENDQFLGGLNLPDEKNLLGYCKSALRLQMGATKKAFDVAHRPVGYSGMLPFWKCEKCPFEGPMAMTKSATTVDGGKSKPEKVFDPAVREFDGIRFKWIFLAKCHVPAKSNSSNKTNRVDGSSGSYGCIFCTAEGVGRGWLNNPGNSLSPVSLSQSSSSPSSLDRTMSRRRAGDLGFRRKRSESESTSNTATSESAPTANVTPVFGNSHAFIEHLQMHRQKKFWPNKEMQKRMKCVVGRVAGVGEDFEINLMPCPLDDAEE